MDLTDKPAEIPQLLLWRNYLIFRSWKMFSRSPDLVLHTSIMGSFHIFPAGEKVVTTSCSNRMWMVGEGLTLAVGMWAGLNVYPSSPLLLFLLDLNIA